VFVRGRGGDRLEVWDISEKKLKSAVACPGASSLALSPDGSTLAVANRGGKPAEEEEEHKADSAGTAVRVDPVTDAARGGSISLIDTASLRVTEVEAGRQPSGLVFSADGRRLYSANSDEDTVAVIDVRARRVTDRLPVRPEEDPGFGQIPTDVALAGDGKTLYVTCGGGNAVAVVSLDGRPRVRGYLGAGWFPIALAEGDGRLFVASSKGIGARQPNRNGKFAVHASVGTIQFISADDRKDLPALTRQVARNNQWGPEPRARRGIAPVPVPERVGEPSVFKHVVYLIKENHTYDLTLGDMPEGNGDRSLTLFGEEVTPNQHALARQWELLDNTYTSGTNSADGHQWTTSAVGNGYIEQNYAAHTRSYPYDGGDPLAYSPEGFLWTSAVKKGLSLRVYGEFINRPRIRDRQGQLRATWAELWKDYQAGTNRFEITAHTDNAALRPYIHPRFIGFPTTVSDQWRADQYLADLKTWEQDGKMPALSILLLPNDHTAGTRAGYPTPRAAVADNDLATGRIIDAITRSRFWKETLILVIEDDSQLGLDHVDGHRTVAFCVSPYTRRGAVVSEPYNHTSFLRTIGLVLGFPAMTRFDRTAQPMRECFTNTPDFRPFTHLKNRTPLDEMNPAPRALQGEARRLAEACDRLDWSDVDRANAEVVARSVWLSVRGSERFPEQHFHAYVEEEDDD
jgi:YVTN family beta-propeller protein